MPSNPDQHSIHGAPSHHQFPQGSMSYTQQGPPPHGHPVAPGVPQGHPGAPQSHPGHPGAHLGHPGASQSHPVSQGHPASSQLHPGAPLDTL
ncbi:hypothetical protein JTB14_009147 [Gonioctena quinquepunctata]|nr:hypothetical protein JTB14_009147 [Gonioctena quinquepunctata]